MNTSRRHHVVVVGAGVAGLAAAHFLTRPRGGSGPRGPADIRVTVLEGSPRIGGKLLVSDVAGLPVDAGAEAMLARRPEGLGLVRELGRADDLVYPGTTSAAIWSYGGLRPLPAGHVMGVPADLPELARSHILSGAGLARAPLDLLLPATPRGADVSVAAYVGARLGREVVDRLVEPLLGGVYAGRVDELSFDATLPALAESARTHRSLIAAARTLRRTTPADAGPVFATLTGGMGTLPGTLAAAVRERGGSIRTDAMVRELHRTADGWRLTAGPTRAPEYLEADAVVIAVPARPAARLLADEAPAAAKELETIKYASMAIITLAYHTTAFTRPLRGSGYLVPAVEVGDTGVKAVTFSTNKWPHVARAAPGIVIVRCSIGRYGEEHTLQRSDDDLKAAAITELARTCGVGELPLDTRVTRWGGGLPQYTVGHADRVARIRSAVAGLPGLAVCGAAYDGIGVPACLATARAAATRVLDGLADRAESIHGSSDGEQEAKGTRAQQRDPIHDVVGLPGEEPRPDRS
ncbi:MAG TPA: protoporphyrinogen oxidase [Streptosporangiaceae bacterium]|nr:protoporphyrinogen oxidase [Streptosporangiaceae bacterium]